MEDIIEKYTDGLPASYLEFISSGQEYVNLWNLGALHEAWEGYKFRDNLEDSWFPIGSNRGVK